MKRLMLIPLTIFCFFTASCQDTHENTRLKLLKNKKTYSLLKQKQKTVFERPILPVAVFGV